MNKRCFKLECGGNIISPSSLIFLPLMIMKKLTPTPAHHQDGLEEMVRTGSISKWQEIADEDEPVYPATATYYRLENSSGYHGRRDTFIRQRRPYISLMIVLVLVYTTIWRKEGILAQVMRLPHNISAAKMIPSISHILSARVVERISCQVFLVFMEMIPTTMRK